MRLFLGIFFIFILLGAVAYQLAQARLSQADVRHFAEAKAAEILQADVKIGSIRYLPPAQIAFQGIQIQKSSSHLPFFLAQTRKLIFGYGLLNLLRWDFRVPTRLVLDSPDIRFRSRNSPFPFFESASSQTLFPLELAIRKGEFH